jgi:hypothetical protein
LFGIGNCKTPTEAPLPCVSATEIDVRFGGVVNIFGNTTNITDVDTVRNTTTNADSSTSPPFCRLYNGFGIWYKIKPFTTNGELYAITTCYGDKTNFDTVITVYRGDSCRPHDCVKQGDDYFSHLCSIVSSVEVSPFVTYWIFVDGAGTSSKGYFELLVN